MHIEPDDLATCLRVLATVEDLNPDHPQAVEIRRATAGVFKSVKRQRKVQRRAAVLNADRAVTARTATGAAGRVDDETRGLPLRTGLSQAQAGMLRQARACYVCKTRYLQVDAFYHQLCPRCATTNHARREARTDLTGRRALLTGGRAKIGMYIALRLLRDGAHTTITTRFPHNAVRRYRAMPDSEQWLHRLRVVGIDLRNPAEVIALSDAVAEAGPLDILINNAAQTVRRSSNAYKSLVDAEHTPLSRAEGPEMLLLGNTHNVHPAALTNTVAPVSTREIDSTIRLAVVADSAADESRLATTMDAGGLMPDLHSVNSWVKHVDEVDPVELLEVQLCNITAPFILVSRLRAALTSSTARRKHIVNVSAMEGQFGRKYKGPGHPHTNMAKAALNMLTRTSAGEMFTDRILMNSVDTGWITDERPHPTKQRLAAEGFHAPLDLIDGASRVYDPIVRGERGEELHGQFLKDYEPAAW